MNLVSITFALGIRTPDDEVTCDSLIVEPTVAQGYLPPHVETSKLAVQTCDLFLRTYTLYMDLRGRYSHKLCCLDLELYTLLGVGEVFSLKDLRFSTLFNKRDDVERIVVDDGTIGGREQDGGLRSGYVLLLESDGARSDKRG